MKQVQYTIRNVPPEVDRVLREQARRAGKSLNAMVRETLKRGAGLGDQPLTHSAFDDLAGKWVPDPGCEEALDAMRELIDEELWK